MRIYKSILCALALMPLCSQPCAAAGAKFYVKQDSYVYRYDKSRKMVPIKQGVEVLVMKPAQNGWCLIQDASGNKWTIKASDLQTPRDFQTAQNRRNEITQKKDAAIQAKLEREEAARLAKEEREEAKLEREEAARLEKIRKAEEKAKAEEERRKWVKARIAQLRLSVKAQKPSFHIPADTIDISDALRRLVDYGIVPKTASSDDYLYHNLVVYNDLMVHLKKCINKDAELNDVAVVVYICGLRGDVPDSILYAFLAVGANPNKKAPNGTTALHESMVNKYTRLNFVKILLDNGADVNQRNYNGKTILDLFYQWVDVTSKELEELLISYGARLSSEL